MSACLTPYNGNIVPVDVWTDGDTYTHIIAGNLKYPGISCDTVSDLPAQAGGISGYYLEQGSTAHVINSNTIYTMQSNGTWVQQDEASRMNVYTKAETDTAIETAVNALDVASVGGTGKYLQSISEVDGKIIPIAETMDTVPTSNSQKAITSDAVYTAINSTVNSILGRGTRIPTNGDCNNLSKNGAWYAENASHAGGITNTPFTTSGYILYQQSWYQAIGTTTGIIQTAESITANNYYQRKRFYIYSGGVWSWTAWITIITQSLA